MARRARRQGTESPRRRRRAHQVGLAVERPGRPLVHPFSSIAPSALQKPDAKGVRAAPTPSRSYTALPCLTTSLLLPPLFASPSPALLHLQPLRGASHALPRTILDSTTAPTSRRKRLIKAIHKTLPRPGLLSIRSSKLSFVLIFTSLTPALSRRPPGSWLPTYRLQTDPDADEYTTSRPRETV